MQKWLCVGAMVAAGILFLVYGLDLAIKVPFNREGPVQDIVFVIASALVLWQGYETWRDVV